MPVSVSYPGVYVEEIPSGLHTITGVATSICAFVGAAPRGDVNVPSEIFSFGEYESLFGGLTLAGDGQPNTLGFAVRDFFLNGGSDAIIVRVGGSGGKTSSTTVADVLTLSAASPGIWGDNVYVQTDTLGTRDATDMTLFNLTVEEWVNGQKIKSEKFLNLSLKPTDPAYVVGYLAANSTLVRAADPAKDAKFAPPPTTPPAATPPPAGAPKNGPEGDQLKGGADGTVAKTDVIGDENAKTGIWALDNVDIFNILCLPAFGPITDAGALLPIATAAQTYCQLRRAVYIMDPPDSWDSAWKQGSSTAISTIKNDMTTLHGAGAPSYAAVYFPRLTEPNPLRGYQPETFASCGAIAGIYARTDVARGVWKAPAGLQATLTGVLSFSANIINAENGKLNEIGVNCLRTFPLAGNVVWGARTMDGADNLESDYKYLPVRRLTLFLEESLYRGTQWVVFEPNDEPLWSQIRLNVGSFMHELFRKGAFQGATPQKAYFVQCDGTTTTQADIDAGVVNILVGFAPLKPAEFVVLQIQQIIGQVAV